MKPSLQLSASSELTWQRETMGKGWEMLLPLRAQAALKSQRVLVHSVTYTVGVVLGPYMSEMVLRKLHRDVVLCGVFFLSQSWFLLPKGLNIGSRGGSGWSCAVNPLKSYHGRGKAVHKISCQAFLCCCLCPHHHSSFFLIVRELMNCCCHCQQRKHRSWGCALL